MYHGGNTDIQAKLQWLNILLKWFNVTGKGFLNIVLRVSGDR